MDRPTWVIVVWIGWVLASMATLASAQPATRPARVDELIDLVERDLQAALANPPVGKESVPTMRTLAQGWQALRRTPDDTTLLDRAAAASQTRGVETDEEVRRFNEAIGEVELALCRRNDAALMRSIDALEALRSPPGTPEAARLGAEPMVRRFRLAAAQDVPLPADPSTAASDLTIAVKVAEMSGRWETARALRVKLVDALERVARRDMHSGIRPLAREDAERAARVARATTDPRWRQIRLIDVADGMREAFGSTADPACRALAETLLRESLPQIADRKQTALSYTLSIADRWGFAELVADAVRARPVPDAPGPIEWREHVRITISAARQGHRELALDRLAKLLQVQPKVPGDVADRDEREGWSMLQDRNLGRVELQLSIIEMLVGRSDDAKARARTAISRFRPPEDALMMDDMSALRSDAVRMGEDDWALQIGTALGEDPDEQSWTVRRIVARDMAAGRFEPAWQRARQLQGHRSLRLSAMSSVAIAAEQAGKGEDSHRWIDALPDASDRAAVRLAVAYTLDGKPTVGAIYWFAPLSP